MFYFRPFPQTSYRIPGREDYVPALDITKRFSIANFLNNASVTFDEYYVQDGERPDTIAYDYYQDYTMDWLVLLVNEIQDPYFEWVMSYDQFHEYLKQKYGGVEYTQRTVHHYEQIIQQHQIVIDGLDQRILPEKTLEVDYTTYLSLTAPERKSVSIYDYEDKRNNDNRHIFLLDPNYLTIIKEQHPFIFESSGSLR
jgi:hypothetical protein